MFHNTIVRTYQIQKGEFGSKEPGLFGNKKFTIQGARSMLGNKKSSEAPLLDKQLDTIKRELLEIIRIINE